MSETVISASPIAVTAATEKKVAKKAASGNKKPSAVPSHPPTQQMVDASIKTLKERGGSSLLAIKKYIAATYKVDVQRLAPFIKKYLKSAVASGKLIQTKGKGASGSFKLSTSASKEPKAIKAKLSEKKSGAIKKKATASVTKKSIGEKKVKKSTATKKTAEKKKVEKSKAKSIKKSGSVKTKVPKPKTTSAKPKVTKPKSTVPKPKKTSAVKKVAKKPAAKK